MFKLIKMSTFRYKVIYHTLFKFVEPSKNSTTAGFFNFKDEFSSENLPFKVGEDYWVKFNREKDNKTLYVLFKEENDDDDYKLKIYIDYSEVNNSININENQENLFKFQLLNSINFDILKDKTNKSTTNPFHLKLKEENAEKNPIQIYINKNYIVINLISNSDNFQKNNVVYEIMDKHFLSYRQNYSFLTKKRHTERGRLSKNSDEIIGHDNLEFDNIKDKIKNFCLKYVLNKLNEELDKYNNEEITKELGKMKLFKIRQQGRRTVSKNYYYNFINKTFKSIFREKVIFQCKDELINIKLIDKIYERKNEFQDIIDFLDMKYIYFFYKLKIYLKSDLSERENINEEDKKLWRKLKDDLGKNEDIFDKFFDFTNSLEEKHVNDKNKILLSLIEDFRESINKYLDKEKKDKTYKEVFILSLKDFLKKLKLKEKDLRKLLPRGHALSFNDKFEFIGRSNKPLFKII